jgi:hypothetical protein
VGILATVSGTSSCAGGTTWNGSICLTNPTAPIVTTTTPITNITQTTATGGGTISSNGGATVTVSGIVWGTSVNPTTANSKTTDGWATGGPWTDSITGLTASTGYHVRAYATNSVGTSYGSDVPFTTIANPVVPTVSTATPTNVTQTTATGNGNVTASGGATVTSAGMVWSVSPATPTLASNLGSTADNGWANYSAWGDSITGLTASVTYNIQAYATNSVGTSYGGVKSFTTPVPAPGVCGTANGKTYPYGTAGYGSDTQCSLGTASPLNGFPASGGSASWICTNGGPSNPTCTAYESAGPTLTANPASIPPGGSSTLTWTSTAASCSGVNFSTPGNPPSGSSTVSSIAATTTYTITCGGYPATATVTVQKKPVEVEH